MLTVIFASLLLAAMPINDTDNAQRRSSTAGPVGPSRTITARAPSLGSGPTRVVCEREKAMDTNIPRRVCREVLVNGSQRERMGSDLTREMQRLPQDAEGAGARSPGGRAVF